MDNVKIIVESAGDDLKIEVDGKPSDIMFFLGDILVDVSKNSGVPIERLRKMIDLSIAVH
ncbi:MAG: hypothetical protein ACI3U2_06860 [Anaerovibrio sp.]